MQHQYSKLKSPSNQTRISGKPVPKLIDTQKLEKQKLEKQKLEKQRLEKLEKQRVEKQKIQNIEKRNREKSDPRKNSRKNMEGRGLEPSSESKNVGTYKLNLIPISRTTKGVKQPNHGDVTSMKKEGVCYYANQGPRAYMEDTLQIMRFNLFGKKGILYGVFDGHGGSDVSFQLVHAQNGIFPFLIEKLKANLPKNNIENIIRHAFVEYDQKLYNAKKYNAGSTAIVALYYNDKIYMVNLGDSRGMIFTNDGTLAVSDDHKPNKIKERRRIYRAGHFVAPFSIYTDQKDKRTYNTGDILHYNNKSFIFLDSQWNPISEEDYKQIKSLNTEADTFRVSGSLALSRSFGDFYLKENMSKEYMSIDSAVSPLPDVQVIDLSKQKGKMIHIFLASDGFWDVNKNTEYFRKNLIQEADPQKWCQELVSQSINKGSQDNTTVMYDRINI